MKIDVATIEHCALETISDFVGSPYEYCDGEEEQAKNIMKLTLGAVAGVLQFADNLKKELEE